MGNLCFPAKRTERRLNHSPDEQIQQKPKKSVGSFSWHNKWHIFRVKKMANNNWSDFSWLEWDRQAKRRLFGFGIGNEFVWMNLNLFWRQLHLLCNQNSNYKLCDEDWNEIGKKAGANAQMEERIWAKQIRKNVLDIFDLLIKANWEEEIKLIHSIFNKVN